MWFVILYDVIKNSSIQVYSGKLNNLKWWEGVYYRYFEFVYDGVDYSLQVLRQVFVYWVSSLQ